jgi:GntR family transcriptional regulator
MKLDETSPAPAYIKVADAIRAAIAAGELQPGAQLPAGPKLATQLGVATMTVRRAIDMLRTEGVLRSSHGVGVFVATTHNNASEIDELREDVRRLQLRVEQLERHSGVEGPPLL